jgi:hypothetical protein
VQVHDVIIAIWNVVLTINWLIPITFRVQTMQPTASSWNAITTQVQVVPNHIATTKTCTNNYTKHHTGSMVKYKLLDFRLSPCFECRMFSFEFFAGIWSLIANGSEHCSILTGEWVYFAHSCLWRWNRQSVPKRWQLNSIRRWTTQEKTYDKYKLINPLKKLDTMRHIWYQKLPYLLEIIKRNKIRNLAPKAKLKYEHRDGLKKRGAFLLERCTVICKPDPSRPKNC